MRKLETVTVRTWTRTIGAMAAGALLYAAVSSVQTTAQAEIRKRETTPPTIHRSGAERSLDALKEISATLKRIEQRMERWERVADK